MKFETGEHIDAAGTSLRGDVKTRKIDLIKVFGEPTYSTPSVDEKVTVEWIIQFENGTIATIYDWKRYELGTPGLFEEENYHIGGKKYESVDLVKEALGLAS